MRRMRVSIVVIFLLLAGVAAAQQQPFEFYPGTQYDPAIPTLEEVVGHRWGEKITMHHEAERYLEALADAAPRRVLVVRFGETWEGRSLYYLVISSEANLARASEIQAGMQRLADPRRTPEAEAERLIGSIVPVTWLAYGVHGNEISSPDAGLLTAYHLLAAQNDAVVTEILENSLVIIDPMQNPDGRDRFINYFRQTRGRWPDADPQAAEHNETWPVGRFNHYLFDMNRDWFAQTQRESRARVAAYLDWYPVVFVDLHEMGGNSTYYFAPPAPPINPNVPPSQLEWWEAYGRNNAAWFDRFRIDYFTREVFDSFYPGYGEGWPLFQGSVGMTYEQASTRGLVFEREDETVLHYRETVQHHFLTSLSTAQTTARNRQQVLRYFYDYRRSAIEEGQKDTVKEYILPPGGDPNRATKLAALLVTQGIEVQRAEAPFTNARARSYATGQVESREFPAGTYIVSLAQPAKRLAKTLLDKQTPADREFLDEQIRRRNKRIGDQIYDVMAWSLPLLYDVEFYAAEQASAGRFTILEEPPAPAGSVRGGAAHIAYLIPWGSQSAARALADLLRQEVRVFSTDKGLTHGGVTFPAGSLIVKVKDNPADLHQRMAALAAEHGVTIHAADQSWVDAGVNFGSGHVRYIHPPRIALAWNMPANPMSAGWTRYVLEQQYGLPVTVIHALQIPFLDLSKYNVLILPSAGFFGNYNTLLGERGAQRIKQWVQAGGTLISLGNASEWLTDEKVGLLATKRELRSGKPEGGEKKEDEKKPEGEFDLERHLLPDREPPDPTPGALLRVVIDTEHWLGFGYDGDTYALVESNRIFTPLKLNQGTNVGLYAAEDPVASGFTYEGARQQLPSKAYLMHQRSGRGHVVAFAEDPNYRAFHDGLNLLFLNGVFFGPRP